MGSLFLVMAAISPIILFHQTLQSSIGLAVLADAVAVGWILFALIEMLAFLTILGFAWIYALRKGDLEWR